MIQKVVSQGEPSVEELWFHGLGTIALFLEVPVVMQIGLRFQIIPVCVGVPAALVTIRTIPNPTIIRRSKAHLATCFDEGCLIVVLFARIRTTDERLEALEATTGAVHLGEHSGLFSGSVVK